MLPSPWPVEAYGRTLKAGLPFFPRTGDAAGMGKPLGSSCKAEALLRAAHALSQSQWFFLIDDDTAVRLQLATAFIARYDWRERHAFGAYSCGATRRAEARRCSLLLLALRWSSSPASSLLSNRRAALSSVPSHQRRRLLRHELRRL